MANKVAVVQGKSNVQLRGMVNMLAVQEISTKMYSMLYCLAIAPVLLAFTRALLVGIYSCVESNSIKLHEDSLICLAVLAIIAKLCAGSICKIAADITTKITIW